MIVEKQTKVNLLNHQKKIIDIIDLNHPLVQLSNSLDWESIQLDFKEIYKSTTGSSKTYKTYGRTSLSSLHV